MSVGQGYDGQMRPFAVVKTAATFNFATPNQRIPFRSPLSNRYGLWDTTRNQFICQVPGSYRIELNASLIATPSSADQVVAPEIYINGVLYDTMLASFTSELSSAAGILAAATVAPLRENDIVTVLSGGPAQVTAISGARLIISYADILTRA